MIAPIRRLLVGTEAPLHVIQDSASLVGYDLFNLYISFHVVVPLSNGTHKSLTLMNRVHHCLRDAAIPTMTLILGANLLRGK